MKPSDARPRDAAKTVVSKIPRVPRDQPADVSFTQERFWFLERMAPGSAPTRVAAVLRLRGPLVVEALESAFREISRRHDQLRATFEEVDGRPQMRLHEGMTLSLERGDVSAAPAAERESNAHAELVPFLNRPFDLERGPPIAVKLVRVDEHEHLLAVCMHHIVSDGWSFNIVIRELAALYTASVTNQPASLTEPAIGYADFAAWQRARLGGDTLSADVAYWKKHLVGAPPTLELPADHPRPRFKQYVGGRVRCTVSPELAARLVEISRSERATVFMVVLAAYGALLSRWSGQPDLVVGTASAGRTKRELESVVGPFVGTLPLRITVAGASFTELVKQVKASVLGAFAHEDVPFEKIVEMLDPPRDTARTPVFQAFIVTQVAQAHGVSLEMSGLDPSYVRSSEDVERGAQFDIGLRLSALGTQISFQFEYDVAIFDQTTVERFGSQLVNLLEAATRQPAARLDTLPIIPADERERLVMIWNATDHAFSAADTALSLFETAAARTPSAVAIASNESTYADLQGRANAIAHELVAAGVKPGDLVGIPSSSLPDLPSLVLAVWKAGAAYVAFDPKRHDQRLHELGERVAALVVPRGMRLDVKGPNVIELTDAPDRADAPSVRVGPSAVAYVQLPPDSAPIDEAVVVEHAQLANAVRAAIRRLDLPATTHAVGVPFASEHGVAAVFAPLALGASVRLIDDDTRSEPERLGRHLAEHPSDVLTIASSDFLAATGGKTGFPGQRLVLVGASADVDEARTLLASRPASCRITALFGRAETAGAVLAFDLESIAAEGTATGLVPSGRPLSNTRVYVLDPTGNPAPVGVFGELCVAGAQVARGHLGASERAVARFVSDPFAPSSSTAARLHRTGERARWLVSGDIELARVADAAGSTKRKKPRIPPRSQLEQEIAAIWCDVLQISELGIDDDFFELGGHSLLVTKVASRLKLQLEREVPIRAIFEAPTVAGLAAWLAAASTDVPLPPIVRTSAAGGEVLSFWQQSILAWERKRAPSTTWTRPLVIHLKGSLDAAALCEAVVAVLERQEALRTVLHRDPSVAPRLCSPGEIPVVQVDMRGATEEELAKFVSDQPDAPFAFDGTPLIRFFLVRRGDEEHSLYLTWHQLIHDGTSSGLLVSEILESYRARVEHRAPDLPPLAFRYTDYAIWERAWFEGGGRPLVESARARLHGAKPLELPTDRPRGATPSTEGIAGTFVLPPPEAARFEQLCQSAQVTFFMGAVAMVGILLGRLCKTDDVTVISPISTRTRDDVRSLAGRFGNWSALRVSLSGDPTVREVLARTRREATAAYAHASVPGSFLYGVDDVFGHPLGRVAVNMPEADTVSRPEPVEAAGITATAARLDKKEKCRTELAIVIIRVNKRVIGNVAGATSLLDEATVVSWAHQLGTLFRTLDLDARISTLSTS